MTTTESKLTMADFCKRERIRIHCEHTFENPHMDRTDNVPMDHWKYTLVRGSKRMSGWFSMGLAHGGKQPKVEEVLDCVVSDASFDGESFEGFCSELGYDEDSRKAERTYHICQQQTKKLKAFLGEALFTELTTEVERL